MQTLGIFTVPDKKMREDAVGVLAGYPIKVKKALPAIMPMFHSIPQPKEGDWLWENDEDGQSFPAFENTRRNSFCCDKRIIYIQPLELDINKDFLKMLKRFLAVYYLGVEFKIKNAIDITKKEIITRLSPITNKIQYHGPSIMKEVSKYLPGNAYGMMCVLFKDIYNKDEDDGYVYGLATKHNRIGVFSFIRFHQEFYDDLPKEEFKKIPPERFTLLSLKVMVHEIGHLFGMKHCIFYNCVLNGCNNFEEFDSKPLYMCPVCIRKLQHALQFNFVDHYEAVAKLCEDIGGITAQYNGFFAKAASNIRDAYGEWYK